MSIRLSVTQMMLAQSGLSYRGLSVARHDFPSPAICLTSGCTKLDSLAPAFRRLSRRARWWRRARLPGWPRTLVRRHAIGSAHRHTCRPLLPGGSVGLCGGASCRRRCESLWRAHELTLHTLTDRRSDHAQKHNPAARDNRQRGPCGVAQSAVTRTHTGNGTCEIPDPTSRSESLPDVSTFNHLVDALVSQM